MCGCRAGIYEPGKQTPTQPAGPHRTPSVAQKLAKMAMLEKLGLFHFKENISANSLYDHMLDIIKVRKYNQAILTNAFVTMKARDLATPMNTRKKRKRALNRSPSTSTNCDN